MLKPHDKVKHKPTGFTGVVAATYPDTDEVLVHYDQIGVLPCKLPTSEYEKIVDSCKICGKPYHETYVFKEPKYDCLKCNKTKEQVEKEVKEINDTFNEAFAGYGEPGQEIEVNGVLEIGDIEDAMNRASNGFGKIK